MLTVVTGCVFSGKTELLIKEIVKKQQQGKQISVIKSDQDTRFSQNNVVSHAGSQIAAFEIDTVDEVWDYIEGCDMVVFENAQYFDWEFADIVNQIADQGIEVWVSGLDLDFTGKPFGVIPELLAYADRVIKTNGQCTVCGETATRSQRLVKGKPAAKGDPIFANDETIVYEPRCRSHHEVN